MNSKIALYHVHGEKMSLNNDMETSVKLLKSSAPIITLQNFLDKIKGLGMETFAERV